MRYGRKAEVVYRCHPRHDVFVILCSRPYHFTLAQGKVDQLVASSGTSLARQHQGISCSTSSNWGNENRYLERSEREQAVAQSRVAAQFDGGAGVADGALFENVDAIGEHQ